MELPFHTVETLRKVFIALDAALLTGATAQVRVAVFPA